MGEMVPIFGMATGIITTAIFFWAVVRVSQSQIGAAIARWIASYSKAGGPDLSAEVMALREQVEVLQQQLAETHERLDFTERVLARGQAADQLPKG